jgi:ElaB/YqjD/DUF883 family membrane-anchored ribosome-binding protein
MDRKHVQSVLLNQETRMPDLLIGLPKQKVHMIVQYRLLNGSARPLPSLVRYEADQMSRIPKSREIFITVTSRRSNHSVFETLSLSFSSTRSLPMPAQRAPYRGQSAGSAHDLEEKATDQFEMIADKASDKFRDQADQAEHIASRVAEQGREVGDKVQQVAGNIKGAVDKSVKDQPMATLAMAAVLGFVLGAIWKS